MGPMPLSVQQPPEGIFHGTRHGREHVGLHSRKLDYTFSLKALRNGDSFWENLIQNQHFALWFVGHPFIRLDIKMNRGDFQSVCHRLVFVGNLTLVGVNYYSTIVRTDKIVVPVLPQGFYHSLKLPWRRGTGWIPMLPRDVDFEEHISR